MGKGKRPRVKPKSEAPRPPSKLETPESERWFIRYWRYWKLCWAIIGPLIAFLSTAWSYQPDISIATGINVDPSQTFGTQFAVTNIGKIPIRNLRFSCGLTGDIFIGSMRLGNIAPVEHLPKGQTVTRTCFSESKDIVASGLGVTASYDWPILPITGTKTTLFVPVKTTSGFVMVPDYQNK